jgi:hypothetical protein
MIPDKIALAVIAAASATASYNWLDAANDWATLIVTVLAGLGAIGAALYHFERWRKLRKEREGEE